LALTPGTRLGVYEVTAQIGEGGMGQVYRARDTKLNRDVALKILPEAFARDPDRLTRFTREAQTLASLNHPNIAHIHGLEESGGVRALVMELVEGEDLSQRIARGAIPLDDALPIAKQIADALEAAHEQGIIHRDLKPANVRVRSDGTVKVLDFGLAKAKEPVISSSPSVSMSPTITTPAMTQAGMILGTAASMSPEQARGKSVDKRADIWAFGAVLFEILTGKRAFPGEDITDTIVSIVSKEPDWSALPTPTPAGVRRLLGRCLKKDARTRVRDIGEARQQIEDLLSGAPEEIATAASVSKLRLRTATRGRTVAAACVTLLVGATALGTWALTRTPLAKLQPMRFVIVPPASQPLRIQGADRDLVISPDGTHFVYVSGDERLMVRTIDQLEAVPLNGITRARSPFFSPDGRWVGVFTGGAAGELMKVSIAGGPPLSLCRYQGAPRGASWGPDDTIVFATNDSNTGLFRVSAAGGEATVLTTPDAAHGEADHIFPSVLPGGRAVLFTIRASGDPPILQVAVLDLMTGEHRILIRAGSQAEYVDTGHLVYANAGTLRAVRFDAGTHTVGSDPVLVVEQALTQVNGAAEFSVSRQGTLVYVAGSSTAAPPRSLVWVNRQGQETPIAAPPRAYMSARLSPDGTRVALGLDGQEGIWIWDLARKTLTRLTDSPAFYSDPIWMPDGRRIIFASSPGGIANLFWRAADNTGIVERLTTSPNSQGPTAIVPDGTRVIVREIVPTTGSDLRVLRLEGPSGRPGEPAASRLSAAPRQTEPLLQTTFNEANGEISPDGRWLAYESDDSGPFQIAVRPFPKVDDGHWMISSGGGARPAWARSGRELIYLDGTNAVTAVSIHTAPNFGTGAPTKLFDGHYYSGPFGRSYDVSPDGQRFLMIKDSASDQKSNPPSIVVVVNWAEELKAKVPTGK
jgi:Tol biopolymer transport system component